MFVLTSVRTLLLAAIVLPAVACGPSPDAPRFTRVTLVTPVASSAWAGIWTALDAGYFAEEGIDLQTVPVADTTRVIPLVASREAQFAAVDVQTLVRANASGADLRAIASVTNRRLISTPPTAGAESPPSALGTTQAYITDNPREVTSVVLAYARGVQRFKSDAAFADQVLRKYLQVDDESVVDQARLQVQDAFDDVPYATNAELFTAIDAVAATLPAVDRSPAAYVDDSFLTRLDRAGAFHGSTGV
jgi:ABC-type nitrate/sulfonate/bicarbonate transport system substrate-binding protein